jgi:SEFIR domain
LHHPDADSPYSQRKFGRMSYENIVKQLLGIDFYPTSSPGEVRNGTVRRIFCLMECSESRPPRVFLSCSHDSPEHQDRALGLANRLRKDGIDALVDQYAPAPLEGWPKWMTREIQAADSILLICTKTYRARVDGREQPGKGRGVVWESNLVYNLLYESGTDVQRFIPVLFSDEQPSAIPLPLQGLTHYGVEHPQNECVVLIVDDRLRNNH